MFLLDIWYSQYFIKLNYWIDKLLIVRFKAYKAFVKKLHNDMLKAI